MDLKDYPNDINRYLMSFMKLEDIHNLKYTNKSNNREIQEFIDEMSFPYIGNLITREANYVGISDREILGEVKSNHFLRGKIFMELVPNEEQDLFLVLRIKDDWRGEANNEQYEFNVYFKYKEEEHSTIIYRLDTGFRYHNFTIKDNKGIGIQIIIKNRGRQLELEVLYKELNDDQKNYLKRFFKQLDKMPNEQDF